MAREDDFEQGPRGFITNETRGCLKCGPFGCECVATPLSPQPPAPLSFRDQCAIAAIAGRAGTNTEDILTKWAFDLADAMAAERTRREGQ